MGRDDTEKNFAVPYEHFPTGGFELASSLDDMRRLRDSMVGADAVAWIYRAIGELGPLARMPAVGDPAPKFELPNQTRTLVSLNGLLAAGPAVVVFYRGVWCPFCSLTLRAYQQHLPEFANLGASLVAVSLQTPDDSLSMAERNALTYHVLSDLGAKASRAYGLTHTLPAYLRELYRQLGHPLPAFNGSCDWELAIPATFVIDRDGIVAFAEATPDYVYRADPQEVLAAVEKLAV